MLDAGHLCLAVPLGDKIKIEDGKDRISVGWGCFVSLFFIEPTHSRYKSSCGCSYRGWVLSSSFFQIGSPGADEMFLSNRPEKSFRRQWSAHLKSRMFFLDYGKNSDLDHSQTNDFQIGSLEADEMFLSNRPKKSF